MELGTALVGLISIALCAIPFVLIQRNRGKNDKIQLKELTDFAMVNGCKLDQYQLGNTYAIGLNEDGQYLFFIQRKLNEKIHIDLSGIAETKIQRSFGKEGINSLVLHLIHRDIRKENTSLVFFRADLSYQISDELESIDQWSKVIKSKRMAHQFLSV